MLAALLAAALAAVAVGGIWIGSALIARHRAQAAADLAALAGAGRVAAGPTAVCRQAAEVAALMTASLRECRVEGIDVVVVVSALPGGSLGGVARAAARAGPVP